MSLKLTFLALKKSGTSCPKWGEGVEVFGQNLKEQLLPLEILASSSTDLQFMETIIIITISLTLPIQ